MFPKARAALTDIGGITRAAFGTPDLRRLQLGWAASSLGSWSGMIVLAIYAYEVGGATAVGLVGLARWVPAAFASPFTSLLGDRGSRRDVLLVTSLLRGVLGLLVGASVLAGLPLAVTAILASLQMIAGMAYKPAQAALLPQLAGSPRQMAAANAVWAALESCGFLIGAAAGGVLIAATSPELALAVTALPYLLAAALIAGITRDAPPSYREHIATARIRDEVLIGFATVMRSSELRTLVGVLATSTFVEGMVDTMLIVLALQQLGIGDPGAGWLDSMWALGGIVGGGLALGILGRGRISSGLAIGMLLIGTPLMVLAAAPHVGVALAGLLVLGIGYTLVLASGLTLAQRLVSDEVLARVFGVVESTYVATTGLGAVTAPLLILLFGVRGALIVIGAILPLLAVLNWRRVARFEAGHAIPERPYALLRGVPLFAPLAVAVVENLALRLTPVSAQTGEDVIVQGKRGDRFYVVDAGEVEVLVDGTQIARTGPGGYFGEIALLRGVPRTATVRALGPTLLYALESDEFVLAVTGNPHSRQTADVVIAERGAPVAG